MDIVYNVSMNHMGHPIASNIRDCYLNLVKVGMQNEIPLIAGGGIGKHGNLAANAAALFMLGASAVQIGKYIMQAAAGCIGSEGDRCNICNIGRCLKGITSQDPRLYRRLDPEKVAERVVDVFLSFDTELKKIMAPLGRSTSLPIGMSDAIAIDDSHAAQRLQNKVRGLTKLAAINAELRVYKWQAAVPSLPTANVEIKMQNVGRRTSYAEPF
ncbi:glutamate synthase-related protein, partial [Thermodesulfitimonas sp.]